MTFTTKAAQIVKRQSDLRIVDILRRDRLHVMYYLCRSEDAARKTIFAQTADLGTIGRPAPLPGYRRVKFLRKFLHGRYLVNKNASSAEHHAHAAGYISEAAGGSCPAAQNFGGSAAADGSG